MEARLKYQKETGIQLTTLNKSMYQLNFFHDDFIIDYIKWLENLVEQNDKKIKK